MFCPKCGSKTFQDSIFCENCGGQLTPSKVNSLNVNKTPMNDNKRPEFVKRSRTASYPSHTASRNTYGSRYSHRKKSHLPIGMIAGLFIIGIIGISAVGAFMFVALPILSEITNEYEYLGSKDYSIEETTNTSKIWMVIHNSIGSINIEVLDDQSELLNAHLLVYSRDDYDLEGSQDLLINQQEDYHRVFFDSSSGIWNSNYEYEIYLYISINATLSFNIEMTTGSISLEVGKVTIQQLYLKSTTGSIEASFTNTVFENFINSSVDNFCLVETTTGSVDVRLDNVIYDDTITNQNWLISTTTGSVNFELLLNSVQNSTIDVDYDVTATTGSITLVCVLEGLVGFSLDPSTTTGDIILDEYTTLFTAFPFYSENYSVRSNIHDVSLTVSTGSIEIIEVIDWQWS